MTGLFATLTATLAIALAPADGDAPRPSRYPLGDAVGVVTAVSDIDISVNFKGVAAIPGRSSSSSRGRSSGKSSGRSKSPSVKLKAVEETVTYRLPPDLTVSRLASSDKLTAADVKVGDAVRVHVVRETTRVNGMLPDVALVATKLTLAKASTLTPPAEKTKPKK